MGNPVSKIQENLRLGIKAARTGRNEEARTHLQTVLEQDGDNILALFWLAFVAPEPAESTRLLEHILALEPDNERAKAGLLWVQQQATAEVEVKAGEDRPDSTESLPDQSLRDQFLSKTEAQQRAKKGALAHRARRTIDPLLVITIILGAMALLALGLQPDVFIPFKIGDSWLSFASQNSQVALTEGQISSHLKTVPSKTKFSSQSDTIVMGLLETQVHPFVPETKPGPEQAAVPLEAMLVDSQPVEFIGRGELFGADRWLFQPVHESLLAHQPTSPDEKWIEVNVTEQRVTAWEGNIPVMSFLSSTGLSGTPTVLGKYNIYWKMAGPSYYLPDVPYTMYFYRGYALHGAYWHNNFGQPMSHGCVNLSIENAKELFEWADPVVPAGQADVVVTADNSGTLVVVHD
jgi:hypothetical protein